VAFHGDYSYDRFLSWRTWLNKCWNFKATPGKVNGLKGKIEEHVVIPWINAYLKDGKLQPGYDMAPQWPKTRAYFENVCHFLKNAAKGDFLSQTKTFRKRLCKFLAIFDAALTTAPFRPEYHCASGCFCLEGAPVRDRLHCFFLFSNLDGVDLTLFDQYTEVLMGKLEQLPNTKKFSKKASQAGYGALPL